MIARLLAAGARHRALVCLLAAALAIAGALAWRATPIGVGPDPAGVQVTVHASVPDRGPEAVDATVTRPLTAALRALPDVLAVHGLSRAGRARAVVRFSDGTDPDAARARVLTALADAAGRLPDGVVPQVAPDAAAAGWVFLYVLADAGPRAHRLRTALDADGDGAVTPGELPPPDDAIPAGPPGRCRIALPVVGCLVPGVRAPAPPRPVYREATLGTLLQDRGPDAVADLIAGFDRDADGHIGPHELLRAANFRGIGLDRLRALQDGPLRQALSTVPGVSEVATLGGLHPEARVAVDPERLRTYGVTLEEVEAAIRRAAAAGRDALVDRGDRRLLVRMDGASGHAEDLHALPVVPAGDGGLPVLLGQVARVTEAPAPRSALADWDGRGEVVVGVVAMRPGADPRRVVDRVRRRLAALGPALPDGVEIHTAYDASAAVREAAGRVEGWLIAQVLAVALLGVAFLGTPRAAGAPIATFGLGVLLAALLRFAADLPIDVTGLSGMAIVLVLLIDGAFALATAGHPPARNRGDAGAVAPMGRAVALALAATAASFLPVVLLGGPEGRRLAPLGWTLLLPPAVASLAAVTVAPAIAAGTASGPASLLPAIDRVARRLYRPWLRRALTRRGRLFLFGGTAAFVAAAVLPRTSRPPAPLPDVETDDLVAVLTLPADLSLARAGEVVRRIDRHLVEHPLVAHALGTLGPATTPADPATAATITVRVRLAPRATWPPGTTAADVLTELDAHLEVPGIPDGWTRPPRGTPGLSAPLEFTLLGGDPAALARATDALAAALREIPGLGPLHPSPPPGGRALDLTVARAEAARFGLAPADVHDVVHTALGGRVIATLPTAAGPRPVRLAFADAPGADPAAFSRIPVPTPAGHAVPLAQVADLRFHPTATARTTTDGHATQRLLAFPPPDLLPDVVPRVREAIRALGPLPAGTSLTWRADTTGPPPAAFAVGLAAMAIVLHAWFRRWAYTAIVLGILFLATAGGWWGVWATGLPVTPATRLGLLALGAAAAQMAVVALTHLDRGVSGVAGPRGGPDLHGRIEAAALARLRSLLPTLATAFLGLGPLLLVRSAPGAEAMRQMALPILAGLPAAAVGVLLVLPAAYAGIAEAPPPTNIPPEHGSSTRRPEAEVRVHRR